MQLVNFLRAVDIVVGYVSAIVRIRLWRLTVSRLTWWQPSVINELILCFSCAFILVISNEWLFSFRVTLQKPTVSQLVKKRNWLPIYCVSWSRPTGKMDANSIRNTARWSLRPYRPFQNSVMISQAFLEWREFLLTAELMLVNDGRCIFYGSSIGNWPVNDKSCFNGPRRNVVQYV